MTDLHDRLVARVIALQDHLADCSSCSICEAEALGDALRKLLITCQRAERGPGTVVPLLDTATIRRILAQVLLDGERDGHD